jgi:hypothetical protein
MTYDGSSLYVGGRFTAYQGAGGNGTSSLGVVKLSPSTGAAVTKFAYVDGDVDALAVDSNGQLFIGGQFANLSYYRSCPFPCVSGWQSTPASNLAVVGYSGLAINTDGPISALSTFSNNVWIGGQFENAGLFGFMPNLVQLQTLLIESYLPSTTVGRPNTVFTGGGSYASVSAIVSAVGVTAVGGPFTQFSGTDDVYLVVLDATAGTPL